MALYEKQLAHPAEIEGQGAAEGDGGACPCGGRRPGHRRNARRARPGHQRRLPCPGQGGARGRSGATKDSPDRRHALRRDSERGRPSAQARIMSGSHPRNTGPMRKSPRCGAKNPAWNALPGARRARQDTLPHAWRCKRLRRAQGQPERAQAWALYGGEQGLRCLCARDT
jgi:hypothetical protein